MLGKKIVDFYIHIIMHTNFSYNTMNLMYEKLYKMSYIIHNIVHTRCVL